MISTIYTNRLLKRVKDASAKSTLQKVLCVLAFAMLLPTSAIFGQAEFFDGPTTVYVGETINYYYNGASEAGGSWGISGSAASIISQSWYFATVSINGTGAFYVTHTNSVEGYKELFVTSSTPPTPAAPSNLAASPVSSTQINLTWVDNSSNETGFQIERSTTSGSGFALITTVGPGATSYPNTGLAANTTYYYRIRATNAGGNSAYTAQASATTLPTAPGAPSSLAASVVSSAQINLSWTDNSSNETGFQIERSTTSGSGFALIATTAAGATSYSNTSLTANTTYYYRIRAVNAGGNSAYTTQAGATTLPTAPAAPTALAATAASSTQINLTWTDNSNNETGFQVERSTTSGSGFSLIATTAAGATSYASTGLTANTTYYYRIRAINAGGNSAYTTQASATTLPLPPAAPSALTATASSSSQINLTWTDNSSNETGFQIERSTTSGSGFSLIATTAAGATSYASTGLTANTTYYYRIRAINAGGNSAYTTQASAATLPLPPAAPSALTATTASSSQINLTWTDNSSNETGFQIERSTTSGSGFILVTTTAAGVTSYSNTGLSASTQYFYRVRATNTGGNSAYTTVATATTTVAPPAAPTVLAATAASSTQINLTWTDNSNNETGFQIERSTTSGSGFVLITTTAAGATSYSNTSLTSNTTYYYRIRAINAGGNSAYTTQASATTLPSAPAAPTALAATAASSTQINLTWTDNSNNETGFQVERSTTSGSGFSLITTTAAGVTSYSNTSLTANTTYYYRIRAINAGGNSAYTTQANATTFPLPPTAPSALTATTASSSQINLAWTDNSNNETGFQIERSLTAGSGFTLVATTAASATSYANTGLSASTQYFYRIRAINAGGNSAYTTAASATTLVTPPAAPTALAAAPASSTQINLTWTDNSNNETGFQIERSTTSGTGFTLLTTTAAGVTSYSNTGLAANTTYYYRVRATNAGGNSAYTSEANATTNVSAPAAPSSLTATTASSTQINLSWTDNANNETGFQIERSTTTGIGFALVTTTAAGVTSYSNTGLTANTTYYYRIRAINAGGNSAYTSEASAVTFPLPPTTPSALAATTASSTQINLTWTDNSNNETGFQIERSLTTGSGFSLVTTTAAGATSYANTGLSPGTQYFYRVRAINAGGSSAYTSEANATTIVAPPGAPSALAAAPVSSTQINLSWTDNSNNETGFQVERSLTAGTGFTLITTTAAGVTTYSNTGLTANTSYYYRVRATNAGGNSAYTTEASATTTVTAPVAPTALSASTFSSTQINLTWTDNSNNESGFQIERSLTTGTGFTLVTTTTAGATSYSNTGLTANTTYYFRVRAVNAGGNSAYTTEASATTFPPTPAAPNALAATATSATQINLTWTNNSNNETGFQVERSTTSGSGFTLVTTTAAGANSYSNTGLTASTQYFYRIRAINAGGNSAYTSEATATTLAAPPAAPSALAATTVSASQINLSWTDNSNNETGFQVERSTTSGTGFTLITTTAAGATSYSNTGLTAATTYYYRIRAVNAGGNSAYTAEANANTTVGIPSSPSILVATATSATQVNLTWTDNSNNETGFQVERSITSGTGFTLIATTAAGATSYSSTGLTSATQYFYRVRAINTGGNSAYTTEASATTFPPPPTAPGALTAAAVSSSQINLTWTDNSNNETGFQVERSLTTGTGFALITTTAAGATTYSNTGLTAGTQYFYRIRAVNAGGNSAYTTEANATTTAAPSVFYRAINLNGAAFTIDGNNWQASSGAANFSMSQTNGGTFANQSVTLVPSTDANRATMIRSSIYGNVTLNVSAVPNGTYDIYIYVWEDNASATYSMTVEGATVLSNYSSGNAGVWAKLGPYRSTMTDGTINVSTTGGHANLSGIEIWSVSETPVNNPPVIANALTDQTATVGAAFNYVIPANTFSDPDAGTVFSYTAALSDGSALPGWLTFNATTQTFSGTPSSAGTEDIRVTVSDGAGGEVNDVFTLTVSAGETLNFYRAINFNGSSLTLDGNNWEASAGAPNFSYTNGNTFANQNVTLIPTTDAIRASMIRSSIWGKVSMSIGAVPAGTYEIWVYVWEDNGPVTYSFTLEGTAAQTNYNSGPAGSWARLGPFTRTINDGTLNLVVTEGYEAILSGIEIWSVSETPVNNPPIIANSLTDQTATVGAAFNYVIPANTFSDPDAGTVFTYTAALSDGSALPGWLTFNATTQTFGGTPSSAGTEDIRVTVSDGAGGEVNDVFTLSVSDAEIPTLSPLIELKFDETSGVPLNTGTLSSTFTRSATTPLNSTNVSSSGGDRSLDFGTTSGNYYVESSGVIEGLENLSSFTITGWLNIKTNTVGSGGNRVVSWINNGGDGVDLVYYNEGRMALGIDQWNDGTPAFSTSGKVTFDAAAPATNWVFFAVSYQSSNNEVKYYFGSNAVDATLDVTRTYNRGLVGTNTAKLAIGHFNDATRLAAQNRMLRGLVDEIRIYGSPLTLPQIVGIQRNAGASIAVTDVSVSPSTLNLLEGEAEQLTEIITPANATNQAVTWKSSNPAIASVDGNGLVTAVSPGAATIIVTTASGNFKALASINVFAIPAISISPSQLELELGEIVTLTQTITPPSEANQNVLWSSSNIGVASVSATGVVSAGAIGNTTITVTTVDGELTAQATVTVVAPDPEPSALEKFAFLYKYDDRKRMTHKKVPGADWVYMVYDDLDRLVMTQDGVQRSKPVREWTFTKYDMLNRPVLTGNYKDTQNREWQDMQSDVNSFYSSNPLFEVRGSEVLGYTNRTFPDASVQNDYLTATYYDDVSYRTLMTDASPFYYDNTQLPASGNYDGQESEEFKRLSGQITAVRIQNLETKEFLWSVNHYDENYRVIQTIAQNNKGGRDKITNEYDFVGKILRTKVTHFIDPASPISVTKKLDYDHAGRLEQLTQTIVDTNGDHGEVIISRSQYNELGQLVTKKLHSEDSPSLESAQFKQHVDYRYNIRGWLRRINDSQLSTADGGPKDYFGMNLGYDQSLALNVGATPLYNGNISSMKWSSNLGMGINIDTEQIKIFEPTERGYVFNYDEMNRLKSALHAEKTTLWKPAPSFHERDLKYDLNGNIKELNRTGKEGSAMDDLTYTYIGNQLKGVKDAEDILDGFKDGNPSNRDYRYDLNGNMALDRNKNIASITYNYLNLPRQVTKFNGEYVKYIYNAAGGKMRQEVYDASNTLKKETDYLGEFLYEGDALQFINHDEGRVVMADGTAEYQYVLKDHLGNTRITFTTKPKVETFTATMEDDTAADEDADFENYDPTPNDLLDYTDAGSVYDKVMLLNGGYNGQVGLGKSFAVVPGDVISASVRAKYIGGQGQEGNLANLGAALTQAFNLSADVVGEATSFEALNAFGLVMATVGRPDDDDDAPKGFLNILVFDKNYNLVDIAYEQIDASYVQSNEIKVFYPALAREVTIRQAGFVYVFVSNEGAFEQQIGFDNYSITYTHSDIVQGDDYYPFGLTFNSYQRENSVNQKYKFNGIEHSVNLDLNVYTAKYRTLDPTIGRWWQLDPKPDPAISLYVAMNNNSVRYSDPLGDTIKFDPGVSKRFIRQFNRATAKLIAKGVGGYFNKLQNSKHVYVVKQLKGSNANFFDGKSRTIGFNPKLGMITNQLKTLSPATLLNHEFDHAARWDTDSKGMIKDEGTPVAGYVNKEEERVIKGSEQRTAREMGEISYDEVTRMDHNGTLFPMKNSTSTEMDERVFSGENTDDEVEDEGEKNQK